MSFGGDPEFQFPVSFDPERPLGPDWTHEHAMMVHSAIACALEELGWHPCPAIKAAWTALAAITTEYQLQELPELPNDEEIGPQTK